MSSAHAHFGVFHLFCGIGGGALGFQQAHGEWRGIEGRFLTLGGVDSDPEACADFEALTGVAATRMDLFSAADYAAFHGRAPAADWREATAADVRSAAGGARPDVVFTSPPCKGFSALLPKAQADSAKYAALNNLTVRGVRLTLEAWADDPPGLFILENVPRITSRGAPLLARVRALLLSHGYEVQDGTHDVGEVGGLAQHRRRYLLVARQPRKIVSFLYRPRARKVRAIGAVLESLPMPDDPAGGPMHRLPRLNWLTWARLALIPAGGDWRDLQGIEPGSYAIEPARCPHFNHVMAVSGWDEPAGAVTGGTGPTQGAPNVADPRVPGDHWRGHYRVVGWNGPARTVTGQSASLGSNAGGAVADPRLAHAPRKGVFRVAAWDQPAGTVVGAASVRGSNGVASVADPRLSTERGHSFKGSPGLMGVLSWESPAQAVTGAASASGSNCPASVADPRIPAENPGRHTSKWRVQPWDAPAAAVTGSDRVGSGAPCVQDPRLTCAPHNGAYRVVGWDETSPTVTASGDVHAQGAAAVADPRLPEPHEQGAWVIVAEDGTWHRPLTTLELAALQGFPTTLADGSALALSGRSQARWRERIGNAVPPPAARAIAHAMLLTLIPSRVGVWTLSTLGTAIWVRSLFRRRRVAAVARRIVAAREASS